MKVRVLTDTIPQWLALALLEHHEPELVVGQEARDELNRELWPRAGDRNPPRRRGGTQTGHLTRSKTHGTESTYSLGCRCAECREARRIGKLRRQVS